MNYKSKFIDGHEVIFSSKWIYDLESEIHFNWYYHQADLVYSNCSKEQKIIEIGLGTGLLSDLLKRRGWNIQTLDIDEAKKPDFCESALDFDFQKHHINTVLAFEIFEHIPFSTFEKVIEKMSVSRVAEIYFSLPWNERLLASISFKFPKIRLVRWCFSVSLGLISTNEHFWELSKNERNINAKKLITLDKLNAVFIDNRYSLQKLNKIGCIQYFKAKKF